MAGEFAYSGEAHLLPRGRALFAVLVLLGEAAARNTSSSKWNAHPKRLEPYKMP